MKALAWLLLGAMAQFYWPAWAIGLFLIALVICACWWLYEKATVHTLRDPLYPKCTGECKFNRACNCPHRRPT